MEAGRGTEALMAWAQARGVRCDVPMVMRHFSAPFGYGAEALSDIGSANDANGTVLVSAPLEACITVSNALATAEGRAAAVLGAQGRELIYVVLVAARWGVGEATQRWGAYVQQLPARPSVPLLWSDQVLALFDGTSIGEQLAMTRQAMAMLAQRLANVEWVNEARLTWAYAAFWSRAMAIQGNDDLEEGLMVPVADLLNHSPTARSTYSLSPDGRRFLLTSKDCFAKGEQVFQNYGHRSDEKLLLSYGFMLPSLTNPLNAASVRLSLSPTDVLAPAKAALLKAHGLSQEQYVMQHPSMPPLSPAFIRAAAVALLLEHELYLCRAQCHPLDAPHLQRRAAAVLHTLLSHRLSKIAPNVTVPVPLLANVDPDAVGMALQYRTEQREALQRGILFTESLLAAPSSSSPSPHTSITSLPSFLTSGVGEASHGGVCAVIDMGVDSVWARVPLNALILLDLSQWLWLLAPISASAVRTPELLFSLVVLRLAELPNAPHQVHASVWHTVRSGVLLGQEGRVTHADEETLSGLSLLDTRDAFLESAAQLANALRLLHPSGAEHAVRLLQIYEAGRGRVAGLAHAYVLLQPTATSAWPRPHIHAFTRSLYNSTNAELELRSMQALGAGDELFRNEDACLTESLSLLLSDVCLTPPLAVPLSLQVSASQRRLLASHQLGCDHYLCSPPFPPPLLAALHLILHAPAMHVPPPGQATGRTLHALRRLLQGMRDAFAPSYDLHVRTFAEGERSIVVECLKEAEALLKRLPESEQRDEEGDEGTDDNDVGDEMGPDTSTRGGAVDQNSRRKARDQLADTL